MSADITEAEWDRIHLSWISPERVMPNNTKGRFRSFQGPLRVQRWGSVFQGKDVRGSFFKAVRKKTAGAGSTASLWAMNDLSPSPSGIDSRLRQTTSDCRWKHACLGGCSACVWKLPQHPGPPAHPSPGSHCKGPSPSPRKQLSWPHLHTSGGITPGVPTLQPHHLFSIPSNLFQTHTQKSLTLCLLEITMSMSLIRKFFLMLLSSRYC